MRPSDFGPHHTTESRSLSASFTSEGWGVGHGTDIVFIIKWVWEMPFEFESTSLFYA